MGLISKEVLVGVGGTTGKYLSNIGYTIPKIRNVWGNITTPNGTKILVKVEDLTDNSHVKVDIECDGCGKELKNIDWQNYKNCVKNDGKYYCMDCSRELFGKEKYKLTRLKNGKSFEQWCIKNNRQDILDRWDYELNDCLPSEVNSGTLEKYWLRCPRGIHKSELKIIKVLTRDKNRNKGTCDKCNSFAQWGIDNICKDFLEKYWDYENNTVDPWEIYFSSTKIKVYINCQNKKYHDYKITCVEFVAGNRCGYCKGFKVHPLDSLGKLLEERKILNIWSDKNKKSPYEYSPWASKEVYWKCPDGIHKDFKRNIAGSNSCEFRCPECVRNREESLIQEKVRLYLETFQYTILHERNCTIVPKNPKTKHPLPFDNEIILQNGKHLIIEVMGIQHYELTGFHLQHAKRNNTPPEYELHYQKLKDRYKRIFAKSQGYFYVEIPYWTDDKGKTWKKLIDKKITEITNMDKI